MQILVTVVLFVVLSQVVDCDSASASPYRPRRRSTQKCKYEMCKKIPNFPIKNCTYLDFYMYDPCSFYCYCYGDNFWYYGNYQEKPLSSCGNDKVCWNGYCEDVAKDVDCTKKYGKGYIAIYDSYYPCTYKCVYKSGCNMYQENKDNGTCCYNSNCLRTGKCDMGTCYVEGGRGCSRYYYPFYYASASGNGEGAQNANAASGGSASSGNEGKSLAEATEVVYRKGIEENNKDAAAAACGSMANSYSSDTDCNAVYKNAKNYMKEGKSMSRTAKMCSENNSKKD